jgi:putative mRNA 3-end processing factor
MYLTSEGNVNILRHRLGKNINITGIRYGTPVSLNGVKLSLHPAGHIPGSSQVRLEYRGEVCVVSGDYKIEDDGLAEPFEPQRCNTFVTESTFALPVFNWLPQGDVAASIEKWWKQNRSNGNICLLCAYSLGKAQRLLKLLARDNESLFVHSTIEQTNSALRVSGYDVPVVKVFSPEMKRSEVEGSLIIATPGFTDSESIAKFHPYQTAFASGWMAVRGRKRWQSIDAGFGLSDHADWKGLNEAIRFTGAEKVFVTHGFTDVLCRWLNENGIDAEVPRAGNSFAGTHA